MTLVVAGILTTTTAESLLLEAAVLLQILESQSQYNPNEENRINVVIDMDEKTATITARLPVGFLVIPVGGDQIGQGVVAAEYLVTPGNTPLASVPLG